jgi:peptide/nickel transport system permease protein
MSDMTTGYGESLSEEAILSQRERLGEYRSQWARIWSLLIRNRSAQIGGVLVIIFLVTALVGPLIFPYNATTDSDLPNKLSPPSAEHIMGTDNLGRDIAIRILHGAPVSLRVGILSTGLSLLIGVFLGEMAGFSGGVIDSIIMRLMDVILAFPALLLAIVIVAFLGPGLTNAMLAIGLVGIPAYARLTRSMAISIREEDYVQASRGLGASTWRIMFQHVLPNSMAPIIVQTTLGLGTAVVETAALGFLGLGQQPPYPEWGKMLAESQRFLLTGSWWALVFPGLAIVLVVLGFNLLGDGLRDALDPRLARGEAGAGG